MDRETMSNILAHIPKGGEATIGLTNGLFLKIKPWNWDDVRNCANTFYIQCLYPDGAIYDDGKFSEDAILAYNNFTEFSDTEMYAI